MLIDIKGKINEKRLSYANTFLPLFEANVNSIQAIKEDSATKTGILEISLVRSKQSKLEFTNQTSSPAILDFIIKDNYNLYVEIISFDKLIRGSKQLNKVLFEKLNLPTI